MRSIGIFAACALALSPLPAAAQSEAATARKEAFKQCLLQSTTPDDKKALVAWVFSAISAHPDIREYVSSSPDKRTAINKKAAGLYQRLMTIDCKKQTAAIIRFDGTSAMEDGFGALGEMAMTELMEHPEVNDSIDDMADEIDPKAFDALAVEIVKAKP
jgi:hypothetical protein